MRRFHLSESLQLRRSPHLLRLRRRRCRGLRGARLGFSLRRLCLCRLCRFLRHGMALLARRDVSKERPEAIALPRLQRRRTAAPRRRTLLRRRDTRHLSARLVRAAVALDPAWRSALLAARRPLQPHHRLVVRAPPRAHPRRLALARVLARIAMAPATAAARHAARRLSCCVPARDPLHGEHRLLRRAPLADLPRRVILGTPAPPLLQDHRLKVGASPRRHAGHAAP